MPAWQSAFPVMGSSNRVVADVAFDADPSSGSIIVVNGSLAQYGGTSLSAPLFAGLWARVLHAHPTVGFAAPVIYALPAADFHDVTSGTNSGGVSGLGYAAAVGYDFSSGRGSMKIGRTVTDVGTVYTQVLKNSDFEKGVATPWTITPASVLQNNSSLAHGGGWFAAIGGDLATTDKVSQMVTIPSGRASATLRFYLHTTTAEVTTTEAHDTLRVKVYSTGGTLLGTLATYSNLDASTGYVEHNIDVSTFMNQTVVLKFIGYNNPQMPTTWDLDDVTITVF
jgi:subtilase family serine protease